MRSFGCANVGSGGGELHTLSTNLLGPRTPTAGPRPVPQDLHWGHRAALWTSHAGSFTHSSVPAQRPPTGWCMWGEGCSEKPPPGLFHVSTLTAH